MFTLAMTDLMFNACSLAEEFVFRRLSVCRISRLRYAWNHHCCISAFILASIASVSSQGFDRPIIYAFNLFHGLVYRMSVIFIPEG